MLCRILVLILVLILLIRNQVLASNCFCSYKEGVNGCDYSCELNGVLVNIPGDILVFEGEHLPGFLDIDVKCVIAGVNSKMTESHAVEILEKFPYLEQLKLNEMSIRNLTKPLNECTKLRTFDATKNSIQAIPEKMFSDCGNLEEINLAENQIDDIAQNSFSGLSKLKNLNLKNNKIDNIDGLFIAIINLEYINLQSNLLSNLPDKSSGFGTLNKLNELLLGYNSLKEVKSEYFGGLVNLVRLELHNNRIRSIDNRAFEALTNLRYLRINNNMISVLSSWEFLNLKSLEEFDTSNNRVEAISIDLFENIPKLKAINALNNICINKNFANFNKTSISLFANCTEVLIVQGDFRRILDYSYKIYDGTKVVTETKKHLLQGVHSCIIGFGFCVGSSKYTDIHVGEFYAHEIGILRFIPDEVFQRFVNLKLFSVTGVKLKHVRDFQNCQRLTTVEIHNNEIEIIGQNTFSACVSIKIIHLENNRIKFIDGRAFTTLNLLEDFYLKTNDLEILSAGMFAKNKKLKLLELQENQINEIGNGSYNETAVLDTLNLHNNIIIRLQNNVFYGLEGLINLHLRQNSIATIEKGAFAGLTKLTLLELQSNQITALPLQLFNGLGSLQTLFLYSNYLTTIPKDTFVNMPNLLMLHIAKNKIERIESGSISLPKLGNLSISDNRLTSITTDMLGKLTTLRIFELSNNEIVSISEDLFTTLKSVNTLTLQNNNCINKNFISFDISMHNQLSPCFARILICEYQINVLFGYGCKLQSLLISNSERTKRIVLDDNNQKQMVQHLTITNSDLNFIPSALLEVNQMILENVTIANFIASKYCLLSQLDIWNSKIGEVSFRNFQSCINLVEATIRASDMRTADENTFIGLSMLRSLRIETTMMKNNFSDVFAPFDELLELHMNNNNFDADSGSFHNLMNLRELHLNNSNGLTLHENSFKDLINLELLKISFHDIFEVKRDMFSGLENLIELNLESNWITEIDEEAFNDLENLKILNLARNGLQYLSALGNLTSLEILSLSSNSIEFLDDLPFYNVTSLQQLYLDNNQIKTLPDDAFVSLTELEILNIEDNKIAKISALAFRSLCSLKVLIISNNEIDEIEAASFKYLNKLQNLDLSRNRIKLLQTEFFTGAENLAIANLQHNQLTEIPCNILPQNLRELNVANNNIKILLFYSEFPLLEFFDFSGNQINEINSDIFETMSNLKKVELYDNPCIDEALINHDRPTECLQRCFEKWKTAQYCKFHKDLKKGYTCEVSEESADHLEENSNEDVEYLVLKSKKLQVSPFVLFKKYQRLKIVELWKTDLDDISPIASCGELIYLDLRRNKLHNLYESTLMECKRMQKLILIQNRISYLDENSFRELKDLQLLDLSFNEISIISDKTFENLYDLKVLRLNNNRLEELPKFDNLVALEEIHLEENLLTQINFEAFNNLAQLHYLNLERNHLTKLELAQVNFLNLRYLDISYNSIESIDGDFEFFTSLTDFFADKNSCIDDSFQNIEDIQVEVSPKFADCYKKSINL